MPRADGHVPDPRAAKSARYLRHPMPRALGRLVRAQFYTRRGLEARGEAARERGLGPRTASGETRPLSSCRALDRAIRVRFYTQLAAGFSPRRRPRPMTVSTTFACTRSAQTLSSSQICGIKTLTDSQYEKKIPLWPRERTEVGSWQVVDSR